MENIVGAETSLPYRFAYLAAMANIMNDLSGLAGVICTEGHTLSERLSLGIGNIYCSFFFAPLLPVMALSVRQLNRVLFYKILKSKCT